MKTPMPFKLLDWIDDNREHLRPPVCNKQLFPAGDFIVHRFAAGHISGATEASLIRPFSPSVSVTAGGVGLCIDDLLAYAKFHLGDGTAPSGDRLLGTDEETGLPVYVRSGRFGSYVQLGEAGGKEKPRTGSLLKSMQPSEMTLADALKMLSLPRASPSAMRCSACLRSSNAYSPSSSGE